MKHLIIIGGGGMGRSVFCIAKNCIGYGTDFDIKGFLDDDTNSLDGFVGYPPFLCKIDEYKAQKDDVFVCSIGKADTKKRICESLISKGFVFYTLISKDAVIHQNVNLGNGCIVAENAIVGADANIGKNCLLQSFSIIGHDCIVEDYVRIDTHSVCVGGTIIKNCATIHTNSVINHKVIIGENAIVAACSFVIRKVKPNTTVVGNPARIL